MRLVSKVKYYVKFGILDVRCKLGSLLGLPGIVRTGIFTVNLMSVR